MKLVKRVRRDNILGEKTGRPLWAEKLAKSLYGGNANSLGATNDASGWIFYCPSFVNKKAWPIHLLRSL